MEEILASIRRIIADEEPAKESPPNETVGPEPLRAAAPPAMPPPARVAPAPAASAAPAMRDEEIDAKLAELRGMSRHAAAASPAPSERSNASGPGPAGERPAAEGLLSPATTAAVDAAFATLAQTGQARGGRTVEELVSELLRPMLKAWLDDNLPALVERLVRAEIERISRARG